MTAKTVKHTEEENFYLDLLSLESPLLLVIDKYARILGKEQVKRHVPLLTKNPKPEQQSDNIQLYLCSLCKHIKCVGITVRLNVWLTVLKKEMAIEVLDSHTTKELEQYLLSKL